MSAAEGEGVPLFKRCPDCAGKMGREDPHKRCMHCLHERGHKVADCPLCQNFSQRTRHQRRARVLALLDERRTARSASQVAHRVKKLKKSHRAASEETHRAHRGSSALKSSALTSGSTATHSGLRPAPR